MDPNNIRVGDVVEIDMPDRPSWTGCMLKVSEVRDWGVIGGVMLYDSGAPLRLAPLRLATANIGTIYRKLE